ncbi:hypothetical protein ZIOFF_047509 [Zingiber officinale]|uniref:Response regulatory domain-containing protein n=1 Tax=Zingiber officinale TaxID=94328 RepID=A0A8J5FXF0_ZINOF|nr:hypothetical protein ZIOFF_047509 [Zingiber officinale]
MRESSARNRERAGREVDGRAACACISFRSAREIVPGTQEQVCRTQLCAGVPYAVSRSVRTSNLDISLRIPAWKNPLCYKWHLTSPKKDLYLPSDSLIWAYRDHKNNFHATLNICEDFKLPDNFPMGLKVLVVDDDNASLSLAKNLLLCCGYDVTTCSQAAEAIFLLQENHGFDLIMTDFCMTDMDGFKLFELAGFNMHLPIIMLSADSRFEYVIKGLNHGACGFLCKPLRLEEMQTIWQFVIKRKWPRNEVSECYGFLKVHNYEGNRCSTGGTGNASTMNTLTNTFMRSKEKKNQDKEDSEPDNMEPPSKKQRLAWSLELHKKFVNAVNLIGIDRAVPKRILDVINVPGLTRAMVASHLQV